MCRWAGWVVGALACATIAGCGGGAGDGPMSVIEFEASGRAAVCRNSVLCEGFPDQASCIASSASETQSQSYDTLVQDVMSGKVTYAGARAPGCIAALDAASTFCTRSRALDSPANSACSGILTGTVPVGGTCFFSFECAPGGSCSQDHCTQGQCCAGACVALPPALPLGGDCTTTGPDACGAGTACTYDWATDRDTCQPRGLAGAFCSFPNTCAGAFYCDQASQTCKPRAATGEPCDLDPDSCDSVEDVCDASTSICTRRLAIGSPCQPGAYDCIDYATCQTRDGVSVCLAEPTIGQPCDPTNGPPCLGSQCDRTSLTCTLPAPTSGACL